MLQGREDVRKEFESELARTVTGKRRSIKAWILVVLCAAVLVSGALAVTAVSASDQIKDQDKDQDRLMDGSCDDCVNDCTSDCVEDCTCDCPCCTE